jgi:hypothetical protein
MQIVRDATRQRISRLCLTQTLRELLVFDYSRIKFFIEFSKQSLVLELDLLRVIWLYNLGGILGYVERVSYRL